MTLTVAGIDQPRWRELASLLGTSAQVEAPVGARTTYRVGGAARLGIELDDDTAIAALVALADRGLATLAVGQGSNLLVADGGFDGVALWLGERYEGWELTGQGRVRLGAAARLPQVARQLAAAGWSGFEWAVGVPGSVGGAVRMNAGGHGSDMAASVWAADIVDLRSGERRWWRAGGAGVSAIGTRRCSPIIWSCAPTSPWNAETRSRPRARSNRSWRGGGPTSRVGPMPARCSPTHRVIQRVA